MSIYGRLGRPLQMVVLLAIACGFIGVYRLAEGVFSHIFAVVLLFVFAAILALLLTPVVDFLQKVPGLRTHRFISVLLLYAALFASFGTLGVFIVPTIISQAHQLPTLAGKFHDLFLHWGVSINFAALVPNNGASTLDVGTNIGLISGIVGALVSFTLVIVCSIYFLITGRALIASVRKLFPEHTRPFDFVMIATGSTLASYVRGQLLLSFILGMYTGTFMALLGVHYAFLLGLIAFFLEFIPIIGAVMAMVLCVAIALLQSSTLGVEVGLLGLLGHAAEAYIIGPRIASRVTQLHPLVAMAALLIGSEVGGVLGALFAVPLAAIGNILLGAYYRSRQGDSALSTHASGAVDVENLPRLGEEIAVTEEDGIEGVPVPHKAEPKKAEARAPARPKKK